MEPQFKANENMDANSMGADEPFREFAANNHGSSNTRSSEPDAFYKSVLNFQGMGALKALGYEPPRALTEDEIREALANEILIEQKYRELDRINQALLEKRAEEDDLNKWLDHGSKK